jgi:hypothetical protein
MFPLPMTHCIRTALRILVFLCLFASSGQAQPISPPTQDILQNIPTRNKVLIYNDLMQPSNGLFNVYKQLQITFVGLYNTSQPFKLDDYYLGQVWFDQTGISHVLLPPYAARYSGTSISPNVSGASWKKGAIDVLSIPIPPELGPIVAVYIDLTTPGNAISWDIDRVVVDGRTFSFANAFGSIAKRYSAHFVLGGSNGDYYAHRPNTWDTSVDFIQKTFTNSKGAGILLPRSLFADAIPCG